MDIPDGAKVLALDEYLRDLFYTNAKRKRGKSSLNKGSLQ